MSVDGKIKPIAVDFGKFYWIIARTDDNTKEATVAKLGDGGLIPTLIGEKGQQLSISENIENKGLILQDVYQWLLPSAEYLRSLGNKAKISPSGDPQYFLAGKWFSAPYLLIKMIQKNLSSIKKYLAPNAPLPIVAVTPSKIDKKIILLIRSALRENELTLVSWLTSPLALYLNSQYFLQQERITTLSIWIEWGSLSIAVISYSGEIPYTVAEEYIEWSWHQWGNSWPEEQFLSKLNSLLEACEIEGVSRNSITNLITGGEDSWSDQIRNSVEKILPNLTFSPLPTPRMAAALGAANITEYFQSGTWCEIIPPTIPNSTPKLVGYTIPEAKIEIFSDRKLENISVPLSGKLSWEFPPHFINSDVIEMKIYSPDGLQFTSHIKVDNYLHSDFESEEKTTIIGKPAFTSNNMTEPSLSLPPAMMTMAEEKRNFISSSSEKMTSITLKAGDSSGEFIFDEERPSIGEGDGATRVLSLSSIESDSTLTQDSIGEGDGATRVLSLDQIKEHSLKKTTNTQQKNESLELQAADLFEEPDTDREEQPTQRQRSISLTELNSLSPQPKKITTENKNSDIDTIPIPHKKKSPEKQSQKIHEKNSQQYAQKIQELSKVDLSLYIDKTEKLTDKVLEILAETSEILYKLRDEEIDKKIKEEPTPNLKLDLNIRREIRKLLDQGRQLSSVEDNRLPTSTRKSIARLLNELESSIKEGEPEKSIKLSLQLANRLMEIIRRDLRPW